MKFFSAGLVIFSLLNVGIDCASKRGKNPSIYMKDSVFTSSISQIVLTKTSTVDTGQKRDIDGY